MAASLLLLGQVPVAHVMSSIRPGAADLPIPTEEEHRSLIAERASQAQVTQRHRKHDTYQETAAPPPSYRMVIPAAHALTLAVPPSVFPGAPRPLRC